MYDGYIRKEVLRLGREIMVWVKPKIEHLVPTIYGWSVSFPENFTLEPDTDLGYGCYINARYGVTIKRGAQLGSHCSVYSHDTIGEQHSGKERKGPVALEEGCCIGSHSVILPNVTVGKSIIIPAFSLVKKSILTPEDLAKFVDSEYEKRPVKTHSGKWQPDKWIGDE